MLIDAPEPEQDGDPRDDVLPKRTVSRARRGDIWRLGTHRLICENSIEPETVDRLMQSQTAAMVFTDPPYNVRIDGHVGGKGKIKHDEFAMASGEMSQDEFTRFLRAAFTNLCRHAADGSIHFICMDWRHMQEVLFAANGVYSELKNLIVWAKDNGGMGTFYRSRHELIFAYKYGDAPHINSFEPSLDELGMHPTVKPVRLIADAIRDVSGRGDIVLDIFGGSGSTLIAAEKTGRRAFLSEMDPGYCDVILTRWERYAKDDAVLLHREDDTAGEEEQS
jgi:DNA modification methylase